MNNLTTEDDDILDFFNNGAKRDVYHTIVNTEIDFKIVTSGGEVEMDDYLSLSFTSYRDAMEIAYNNKSLDRGKEYKISKQSSEFTDSSEFITYLITEVQTDTTKTIELSKPVCNIMVGYPSCGKSTYIAENLKGYTIIGFDSTLESLLNQEGNKTYDGLQYMYQGMTINEKKGISNITKLNFISALEEGENVVVDQTNLRSEDRLKWINIVQEIAPHYIINAIEFMTPINTCVTRKRHGKTIALDVYERMHRMREDITDSEYFDTHLKIDNVSESFESMLEVITNNILDLHISYTDLNKSSDGSLYLTMIYDGEILLDNEFMKNETDALSKLYKALYNEGLYSELTKSRKNEGAFSNE